MKAVILAGGLGTRISEESTLRPKPMIEIGGKPLLWHIMRSYSAHNINEFIICCGYKGYMIKEYFVNYFLHNSDVSVNLQTSEIQIHNRRSEPWKVTMVETGANTMTGGRLLKIKDYLDGSTFCMTYGDGLSDINITDTISFHKKNGKHATMTTVQPPGRFGSVTVKENSNIVDSFREKPSGDGAWINGGFFVLENEVFKYLVDDHTIWEQDPLINLAKDEQLVSYKHSGFWSAMDTLRDKNHLEELWNSNQAPWKA